MNKTKLKPTKIYFTKFMKSLRDLKGSLKRKLKKFVFRKNYQWKK